MSRNEEARLFKSPEDYDALEYLIENQEFEPAFEGFLEAEKRMGGEAYFKTSVPGAPIHALIFSYMGIETFSIEWSERRERIDRLHELMMANTRKICEIVAQSPARLVQSGGNYTPEVLGKERFLSYVAPQWDEICAILHQGNKLVGSHLDANNLIWAEDVAASGLDWIEAFTPSPDTDMSVADARRLWPGKTLFCNFPSSVHVSSKERIYETTREMLRQAAPGDRFIIGITETVPENRWRESYATIMDAIDDHGRLPLAKE